jgi:ankyrin repeat protein
MFNATFFTESPPSTSFIPPNIINATINFNQMDSQTIVINWLETNDIHCQDANGLSLLHYAVSNGHIALLELLISKDFDINLEDRKGENALIHVIGNLPQVSQEARIKIIPCIDRLMRHGIQVSNDDILCPKSATCLAALQGDLEIIKLLEQYGVDLDEDALGTPLWWATSSENPNPELIEYLKSKGCTLGSAENSPVSPSL